MVSSVERLAKHWQQGDLRQFMREFRTLRQNCAKTHAKLIESIVDMAWKRAVRDDDEHVAQRTHADRSRACLGSSMESRPDVPDERACEQRGLHAFERYGMAYADDLARVESLPPAERPIAAALAYQYMARSLVTFGAEHVENTRRFPIPRRSRERPWLEAAARAYRKSIANYERLESAYLELAQVHTKMDEHDKAAIVLEKLVSVIPDNYDAHVRLAHYYLGQDEPGKSERHVEAAVRLHPRDERTVTLRWCQRVTMIRCLAQQRQFAAAEQELEQAAAAVPDNVEPYTVPLIRTGSRSEGQTDGDRSGTPECRAGHGRGTDGSLVADDLYRGPVQIARGRAQGL